MFESYRKLPEPNAKTTGTKYVKFICMVADLIHKIVFISEFQNFIGFFFEKKNLSN